MVIKKKDMINKTHAGDDGLKNKSFVTSSCLANNKTRTAIVVAVFVEKYKLRITLFS